VRGAFLDPTANWRALKGLLIEVPLGILIEGMVYVLGVAAVVLILIAVHGC
jgi:hypothetical protein